MLSGAHTFQARGVTIVRGLDATAVFVHDRVDADFYAGNRIVFKGTVVMRI